MKRDNLIFILIVIIAAVLRLYRLDLRVFHHDEAAVGYFANVLFTKGTYSYDPAFHGPFLYYFTDVMFHLFGVTDFAARLMPVLFGIGTVMLVYPMKKYLGTAGTLFAAFFFAVSPSFLYYSRFYREDIPVVFFTLSAIVCGIKYSENMHRNSRLIYIALGALSLSLSAATKESTLITIGIFGLFLILYFIRSIISDKKFSQLNRSTIIRYAADVSVFLITFIIVYSLLFTSRPFDIQGSFDSVMKAFGHWLEMHQIKRIGGPFFFYLPIIALYELPILIFGVLGMAYYGCGTKKKEKMLMIFLIYWVIADIMYYIADLYPSYIKFLPISYFPTAMIVFLPIIIFGILAVLRSDDLFFAFFTYFGLTSLFIYSYFEEKVPWLVVHIMLPVVIVASGFIGKILSGFSMQVTADKKNYKAAVIILVFSSVFLVYSSLYFNYYDYTNPAEPLVQAAQPPQKFRQLLDTMNETAANYSGVYTEIQITDPELNTMLLWYVRDYKNVKWGVDINSSLYAPLIIVHNTDADMVGKKLTGYRRLDSAKMSWYWFRYSDITPGYVFLRSMDRKDDEYGVVLFYKEKDTTT